MGRCLGGGKLKKQLRDGREEGLEWLEDEIHRLKRVMGEEHEVRSDGFGQLNPTSCL